VKGKAVRTINLPRDTDDLASFGHLMRFEAQIYNSENEGKPCRFAAGIIDGDIAFPLDRTSAERAFEVMADSLYEAESEFLEHGNQEGFVALFETPKGIMLVAGSNRMGFNGPDLGDLLPGVSTMTGMPNITWPRIMAEMFPNEQ